MRDFSKVLMILTLVSTMAITSCNTSTDEEVEDTPASKFIGTLIRSVAVDNICT